MGKEETHCTNFAQSRPCIRDGIKYGWLGVRVEQGFVHAIDSALCGTLEIIIKKRTQVIIGCVYSGIGSIYPILHPKVHASLIYVVDV